MRSRATEGGDRGEGKVKRVRTGTRAYEHSYGHLGKRPLGRITKLKEGGEGNHGMKDEG
jgi:hypothetical protein